MSRLAVAVVLALVLPLLAGPAGVATAQSGETVTLTVAVRDRAGDLVADADLDVEWDGGSTTATTAANGRAFVDVPAGATVRITVNHPRYLREDPFVLADVSEREVSVTVYRKSTIRLEVSDPNGSVADASVLIERGGLDVATGTTDANGVFETGVIRAGDYTVTVTKPGYYNRTKPLAVEGDVTNRVALRPGSVDVTVRVTDPHFDPATPVADASVALEGVATDRTDPDGTVTVTAPVNTETTLRVTKSSYRTVTRRVRIGEANDTVAVGLSRTPSLTVEVVAQRVVAGERVLLTATDAYGDPATGVTVTLDGDQVGTTDADGELAVRIDDPGTHTLRASTDGTQSNELTVEAIAADGATATPTANATPTATATPTGTGDGAPGFTPALAVVAVLATAFLLRARQD
jgi:PGF-CTERM protein